MRLSSTGGESRRDLLTKINSTLEPLLGAEKFRAGVSVECDFTSGEQSEETYDPETSVMTSSQKTEETTTGNSLGRSSRDRLRICRDPPSKRRRSSTIAAAKRLLFRPAKPFGGSNFRKEPSDEFPPRCSLTRQFVGKAQASSSGKSSRRLPRKLFALSGPGFRQRSDCSPIEVINWLSRACPSNRRCRRPAPSKTPPLPRRVLPGNR